MDTRLTSIPIPYDEIAAFCERHHIRKLSLFGSVLRDDFRPHGDDPSDVDVLVEFESGHTPGWNIVSMENEISKIIGWNVDFRTPEELSRHFRQKVIETALTIYERK
jgi:predicted nucleotidyltransferase